MRHLVEQWATPRVFPVIIKEQVTQWFCGDVSEELLCWLSAFESLELEVADPAEVELRAPGDIPSLNELLYGSTGVSQVADLYALFCAAVVFAQQDAMSYLASLYGTRSGCSKTYMFHPEDWGIFPSDSSISVRLFHFALADFRLFSEDPTYELFASESTIQQWQSAQRVFIGVEKESELPPHLEPSVLAPRVEWLVRILLGLGDSHLSTLRYAPTIAVFEKERSLISTHAHLAAYWLFAHWVLGNTNALQEVLQICTECTHPIVCDIRDGLNAILAGKSQRLGPLDMRKMENIRADVVRHAPRNLFEPQRRLAVVPHSELRTPLENAAAKGDLRSIDLLHLWDHIESTPEKPFDGMQGERLGRHLVQLATPQIKPLVDAYLTAALAVEDEHPFAIFGLLLTRAKLSRDFKDFERAIHHCGGTNNLGLRRKNEYWESIAYFNCSESNQRLFEGAELYLNYAHDWIRAACEVPWRSLLSRDVSQTHKLVSSFLHTVRLSRFSEPLVFEAVEAVRRFRIHSAVSGIRRIVRSCFGRIDNRQRFEAIEAITELDRDAALFLSQCVSEVETGLNNADDEDTAFSRSKDLACLLGALLVVDSQNVYATKLVAALLGRFAVLLSTARQLAPETLLSIDALIRGIHRGEVYIFKDTLKAYSRLKPAVTRKNKEAYNIYQKNLAATLNDLGLVAVVGDTQSNRRG